MNTLETVYELDRIYLNELALRTSKRLEALNYEDLCRGDIVRLKRKLEDVMLLIDRAENGYYRKEDSKNG